MLRASLYIIACSTKNRVRMRLRRLREPRYLLGAIAGAAYLYFAVFGRIRAANSRGPRDRAAVETPSVALQGAWASLAGVGVLFLIGGFTWILPSRTLFDFSEAETQFLFPAPVSRRQLLLHRLMRSQLGLLFAGMVPAFVITAPRASGFLQLGSIGARLERGIALWILFVTMRLYGSGVSLARSHLTSSDP